MTKFLYFSVICFAFFFCFTSSNGLLLYLTIGLVSAIIIVPLNLESYKAYCNKYNLKVNVRNYIAPFFIDLIAWPLALYSHASNIE